jgi:hypothetical protein
MPSTTHENSLAFGWSCGVGSVLPLPAGILHLRTMTDPFIHFLAGIAAGLSLYHSIITIQQRIARRSQWPRRIAALNRERI